MPGDREKRLEQDPNSDYLDQFSRFVDKNKRIITYALYGVSAVGGFFIFKSLKLFKQFKSVKDIPTEFVVANHNIFGVVTGSELVPERKYIVPLVKVAHIPIFGKVRQNTENVIPVVISGVRIHHDHLLVTKSLLKEKTLNKKVKLELFSSSESEVRAKVVLKKFGFWSDCLGQCLIKKGLAEVLKEEFEEVVNKSCHAYRAQLEKQETYARKMKVGLWRADSDLSNMSYVDRILKFMKLK